MATGPIVDGAVSTESEGGGMSQAQKDKAAAMVAAALAACGGGPFEDPDLPPSKASLWLDGESPAATLGIADPVASWRRMEGGRLFLNDWDTEGVVRGALPNHWLAAASNVVAGDQDIVAKCFVDVRAPTLTPSIIALSSS